MNPWYVSGLAIEGIVGSGKSTLSYTVLSSDRCADRKFSSTIVVSEHHTQRVLEPKKGRWYLLSEDNLHLFDSHVMYIEGLQQLCAETSRGDVL